MAAARRIEGLLPARIFGCRAYGFALVEFLFALVLFGLMATGFALWVQGREGLARAADAGRTVSVLADGVAHWLQSNYAAAHKGSATLGASPVATLRSGGWLPSNFQDGDAMKRALHVEVRATATGVEALSGQRVASGDPRHPLAGVAEGREGQLLGLVHTGSLCPSSTGSPCLLGPGVERSLSGWGWVREGALLALYEYNHDDWCGEFLHRTAVTPEICPDGNVMETALDMGGQDIVNVSVLEADHIEVSKPPDGGSWGPPAAGLTGPPVTGGLIVGGRLKGERADLTVSRGTLWTKGGLAANKGKVDRHVRGDDRLIVGNDPNCVTEDCGRLKVGETLRALGAAEAFKLVVEGNFTVGAGDASVEGHMRVVRGCTGCAGATR